MRDLLDLQWLLECFELGTLGILSILELAMRAISVFARCEQDDVRSRTLRGRERERGTITPSGKSHEFSVHVRASRTGGRDPFAVRQTEEN